MASSVQIIPYYAHPHVHTVIFDHTWYEESVAEPKDPDDLPFATCCVTGADTGIDNTFVRLSNIKTKLALFGRGNFKKYGQSSLQADELFKSGQMNVWFCRVLPDNATYSNVVVLANYRVGKILDDFGQETGTKRLEIKYTLAYAAKPFVSAGATDEEEIQEFAESLKKDIPNPHTGYMTIPLFYARSIGRGQYGDQYSLKLDRDREAEKEYSLKMYRYSLLQTNQATRITNVFAGSMYQTARYEMSTLIDDVLDQFSTGSCPIKIKTFEENFIYLYNFYQDEVVKKNADYLMDSGASQKEMAELRYAQIMPVDQFDPIFGYKFLTRSNELIPYYRNYTVGPDGPWHPPELTIPNTGGATRPMNTSIWPVAEIGARVLVMSDPLHGGLRWIYNVVSIDTASGNIEYDEGYEIAIDADQYEGINLTAPTGFRFNGGHDGDFQEVTIGGVTRPPSEPEMKLLLSKEYVKAFRGEKDRKILSPARVNLDFIFDANYNMTTSEYLTLDTHVAPIYNGSTVLTDRDAQQLAILGSDQLIIDFSDLNVKRAMYDLNQFRTKNGMTIDLEEGAGCLLHLDCNLTGLRKMVPSGELLEIINNLEEFDGRNTSIDLGYYSIFDPYSGKKINVAVSYFIAGNLLNHLIKEGINKPFVYDYATLTAIQRNTRTYAVTGNMIKDSFRPDIDLIDWDVKERLFTSRINYYICSDEGRQVQRATQNTRQRDASALLEENNVRVLNTLKKGLEKATRKYFYDWNEPEVRRGYTESQMEIYRPWVGSMVHDIEIVFTANDWEQERMIMRCLVYVAFRDIIKRIVLEINIMRPDYESGGMKVYDYGAATAAKKYGRTFDYAEEGGNQ
jgi:hypothetical protein